MGQSFRFLLDLVAQALLILGLFAPLVHPLWVLFKFKFKYCVVKMYKLCFRL